MINEVIKYLSLFFLIPTVFFACKRDTATINLITDNLNKEHVYTLNYDNAYEKGFVIPHEQQDGIVSFKISFKVNGFENKDTIFYKLFYQNESYKFPDKDSLSCENFYGSSAATLLHFKKIGKSKPGEFIIDDEFIIEGNPRNESRFFGENSRSKLDTSGLATTLKRISGNKEWMGTIKEKATANGITIEEQLKLDALWTMSSGKEKENNRWQRNPRVGKYSLLLVVTTKESANETPTFISNTTVSSEHGYVNPYHYFKENTDYDTYKIDEFVTVKATVPITKGIYIHNPDNEYDKSYYNNYVGDDDTFLSKACFEMQATSLHQKTIANVPVKAKFLSENYTKKDYFNNIKKYADDRVTTRFVNTESPGKTFGVDTGDGGLWFKNPYYENEYRKENVGVKTRHGFTYGKYTFKIKMANLLTKDNVWTGLTNALWMVTESGEEWNRRRICNNGGFMPFYGAGKGETRVPQISYSEIDFEILKTAEVWPWTSYEDKKERKDPESNDDKVMVTCSNWDMACLQPKNFDIGLRTIEYKGEEFYPHRWNEYYNALTAKSPQKDSELFSGEYFYFQIEWKPTEIIWRIGPSKNQLRVVGYMNDDITTIPNNQMVAVITQEYHFAEWWPKSPYKQENVPFPGEDLKGKLYSLEIE